MENKVKTLKTENTLYEEKFYVCGAKKGAIQYPTKWEAKDKK